jgi:hypothetical protein
MKTSIRLISRRVRQTQRGATLIELLIAALLTAILGGFTFRYYASMHQHSITQTEIADMHQVSRSCLDEISRTLRMAGWRIGGHPAYTIQGDSLYVFYSETNPVDTVLYFLEEYTAPEYAAVGGVPTGMELWKLMKKVNGGTPEMFADRVSAVQYTVIDSATVAVTLTVQTARSDETFADNQGYRTFINTERVNMRNVSLS